MKLIKTFLIAVFVFIVGLSVSTTFISAQTTGATCIQTCVNRGGTPYECAASCGVNTSTSGSFGEVKPPPGVINFGNLTAGGPTTFLNNIIKTLIVIAGIYSLFNFVLAGYGFLSANSDPKKIEQAWAKISQTIIGLAFTAGAFVIAALVGQIIFGDPTALLKIKLFGPGQ